MLDFVKGDVEMTGSDISTLKLLIVDDDDFILNLSRRILERIGCGKLTTVNDGRLAIEKITSSPELFDIIITDLNMPGMDGVELLRHIAGVNFSGGIILLSGEDERILETAYDLARSHHLNVLGTIQKPLHPDPLKILLESFNPRQQFQSYGVQEPLTVNELREGINGKELTLFYQPKVSIRSHEITGVEALARWNHPQRGLIGPATFVAVAEQNGLIDELTRAVYRKAVRQAGEWQAEGIDIFISINISVNSFASHNFTGFLTEEAEMEKVDPSSLILEVTESQVMSDIKGCLEKLVQMRMKRFGLSIDDFGTGNSSMKQLKSIPFTELKIDRSFVTGAVKNSSAFAILESSIGLGKKMNMLTVAEGVETKEDWELLKQLDCDCIQGYYVARPMPADEVGRFIRGWSGPH